MGPPIPGKTESAALTISGAPPSASFAVGG